MNLKKHIPNLITLLNLSLGFLAILWNDSFVSPLLIMAAGVADLLDGLLARLLKVKSEFGGQLDSFADLVSFGIAPAFLYYHHVLNPGWISMGVAVLIPVFSTIRLAVFNLDDRQSTTFLGLPTPANGLFFVFMVFSLNLPGSLAINPIILLALPLLFIALMVSKIPMISIKGFKLKDKAEKYLIYILVVVSAVLFTLYQWISIPLIILIYILLSIILAALFFVRKRVGS